MNAVNVMYVVLSIVSVLVSGLLIPYIKSKTKKEDREYILSLVEIAVNAAEQIYRESGMGKEKKQYVLNYLESKNIKVSMLELDGLIEASVMEINKWKKELKTPVVNIVNTEDYKATNK